MISYICSKVHGNKKKKPKGTRNLPKQFLGAKVLACLTQCLDQYFAVLLRKV